MNGTQAGGNRLLKFGYDARSDLTTNGWSTLDTPQRAKPACRPPARSASRTASCQGHTGQNPDSAGTPITGRQYTYRFDPIGNRTIDSGDPSPSGSTTYASNALNQYTSTTGPSESFTYDDDGNLTQDGTSDYQYDGENRLISVAPRYPAAISRKLVFTYDYMSRRIRKQAYAPLLETLYDEYGEPYSHFLGWSATPSLDRKFVYDGWNLLEELNALSSDAIINKYSWGLDLSGLSGSVGVPPASTSPPGIHAAGGIGGLLGMQPGSTSYIYFYDANGNVMQVMRADANLLGARYELYPYGGELVATGTAATVNPFRFSTKYWDAESQLYYSGYRFLRPKSGRWTNHDPLEEYGGTNMYAYVSNHPSLAIDPFGLEEPPVVEQKKPQSQAWSFTLVDCPFKQSIAAKKILSGGEQACDCIRKLAIFFGDKDAIAQAVKDERPLPYPLKTWVLSNYNAAQREELRAKLKNVFDKMLKGCQAGYTFKCCTSCEPKSGQAGDVVYARSKPGVYTIEVCPAWFEGSETQKAYNPLTFLHEMSHVTASTDDEAHSGLEEIWRNAHKVEDVARQLCPVVGKYLKGAGNPADDKSGANKPPPTSGPLGESPRAPRNGGHRP